MYTLRQNWIVVVVCAFGGPIASVQAGIIAAEYWPGFNNFGATIGWDTGDHAPNNASGQNFLAEFGGPLLSITFGGGRNLSRDPAVPLIIEIHSEGPDGLPETTLGGVTVPPGDVPSACSCEIDFSGAGVQLQAGDRYVMTLRTAVGGDPWAYSWSGTISDGYANGNRIGSLNGNAWFADQGSDHLFRVTVPEPSSAMLLGLCTLGFLRHRKP